MNRFPVALTLVAVFCLWNPSHVSAQETLPGDPEGKVISEIEIEFVGSTRVDAQRILANMQTREGLPYRSELVQADIKNLRERRIVEYVDILPVVSGDTVKVEVMVMATGSLEEIVFEGNTRFGADELRKEVDAEVGQPIDDGVLLEGKFNIEELYRDRGFSDVTASYRQVAGSQEGFTRVIYSIAEGESNRLRKVFFEGNTAIETDALRDLMQTKQRGLWSRILGKNRIDPYVLEEDKLKIEEAYQNLGYMDARVTRHELRRVEAGSEFVDLIIHIREGVPYTVADVRMTGNATFSNAELSPEIKLTPGQTFSLEVVKADAQRLEDHYGSRGYADARVTYQIDSLGEQRVRITYVIREGEISYIRHINITGMDYTKDEVIRRELTVEPGDLFNTVKLRQSKNVLENTGYFAAGSVEVIPQDTTQPGYKDVTINVAEGKTGNFSVGGAFTSVENLFGYVEFSESNFDIANWNRIPPRGAGQKFQFSLRYGTRTRDFLLGFTEPWFLGRRLALGGELFWRESLYFSDEYSQRNAGVAVWLRKPLNDYTRIQLEYRAQEVEIYDLENDEFADLDGDGIADTFVPGTSPEIAEEEGSYFESKLSLELLQDTRDNFRFPRTGRRSRVGVSLSGGFLGGDVDTYEVGGSFTQYVSLPGDTVFSFHTETTIVDTWAGGDRVPIFNRQFLGGLYDLRGFRFRDVGPVDEQEEPLGGGTAAWLSVEYDFPVIERVRGAVFLDAGFVNEDSWDFGASELNANVGLGVTINSPFGPLRLDYGYPIERSDHQSSKGRVNFNFGTRF